MSVLYIVLPLAILLAIAAVLAFSWAIRTGQMDDLQTPALRILHDDVPAQARRAPSRIDDGPESPSTQRSSANGEPLPGAAPGSVVTVPESHRERLSATCAETPQARARGSQHDG
jgi:cbb3-type cytochrome oxidase maturation protein